MLLRDFFEGFIGFEIGPDESNIPSGTLQRSKILPWDSLIVFVSLPLETPKTNKPTSKTLSASIVFGASGSPSPFLAYFYRCPACNLSFFDIL